MARPKLGETETQRLHVKITEEEITAIDDWRFANRINSRSEAVRRLVQVGLDLHHFAENYGQKAYELADRIFDKREGEHPLQSEEYDELFSLLIYVAIFSGRALRYGGQTDLETLLKSDERLKIVANEGQEDDQ